MVLIKMGMMHLLVCCLEDSTTNTNLDLLLGSQLKS